MLRLKELRNSPENPTGKKLSQQKMADILKVSRSTIAMWETGASDPDTDSLQRIANYFNVSVDYILGRYETSENKPSLTIAESISKYPISDEEYTFLTKLRQLDDKDRAYIDGQLTAFLLSDKYM